MGNVAVPVLCLLAAALIASQSAAAPASARPVPERGGWKLIWQEEFDTGELDLKKWEVCDQPAGVNNEQEYYRPDQVKIVDGVLQLTATNQPFKGLGFRSGKVMSYFTQTYGRFECRAKLPSTQGMWPAFWLLPRPADWPRRGEIDVMESKGRDTRWFSSAYHFADPETGKHKFVVKEQKPTDPAGKRLDLAADFHVYSVEWEPGELRFYFDQDPTPVYRVTQDMAPVSDQPMGVILNLAVGGWFDGNVDATTVFPQRFEVDYVRVWQRNGNVEHQPTTQPAR